MTSTALRLAARSAAAGLALTAMSILAASPASAAVPTLFTYLDSDPFGYATMDATTGAVTPLPTTPTSDPDMMIGQELTAGVGYAIGVVVGDPNQYFLYDWSPVTGASTAVSISQIFTDQGFDLSELDTLPDGRLATSFEYIDPGDLSRHRTIATIDVTGPSAGEVFPVIDADGLDADFHIVSLATDPSSGVTYAFLSNDSDTTPYFSVLDFGTSIADATISTPIAFTGTDFDSGEVLGADFDASATLWFIYANYDSDVLELSTLTTPSSWPTDARHIVADVASNYPGDPVSGLALTAGPQASAALASTGAEVPLALVALATVAVLGGVVTVATARRRLAARP